MNLLDLFVKISVDDQASKHTETLSQKIGHGLEAAAKIGLAAVTAAASGVTILTKKSVENYSQLEQLVGGVETLFKKSSDIVIGYANNAYKTAGMNANDYMETVTGFSSSLLQSLSGDTTKASNVANTAIVDMADNVNKFGGDIQNLKNAYAGFSRQNFSMLDNLKLGYAGSREEMQRLLDDASKLAGTKFEIGNFADIIEAIHVIQNEMGIAGATAKEAATTISGSGASMLAAWENLVTGMSDENADFAGLVNNFVDSVGIYAGNLLPRIEVSLNGAVMLIEGLAPKVVDALPGLVKTVAPAAVSATTNLVGAALNVLPSLVLTLINTFADALVTHTPSLIPAGVDVIIKLAMMLTDPTTLVNIINAAVLIMIALADGIIEALPRLIEAAPVIISSLVTALVDTFPMLINTAALMIVKIVEGIGKSLPKILDAGTSIIAEVVSGAVKAFGKLIEAGANIVTNVKSGFSAKLAEAKTWGKDLIDNFINGIKEKWNNLKQTVMNVAQSIKDVIGFSEPKKGPLSNFHTYAPDMMALFAQGVRENEHVVTDQIAKSFDFGQRTIDFASSAQGKSSSAMINGMMLAQDGESDRTYVAELYLDGEKVAESTYKPTKKIQKREGAPAIA